MRVHLSVTADAVHFGHQFQADAGQGGQNVDGGDLLVTPQRWLMRKLRCQFRSLATTVLTLGQATS